MFRRLGFVAVAFLTAACVQHRTWRYSLDGTVPTSVLEESTGSSHCGWQDTWFIYFRDDSYVQDTQHRFHTRPTYDAEARLPAGAKFTGLVDGDRELWAEDGRAPRAVYVVTSDHVERWPRFPLGCA
jgi:hypothetical protein